MDLQQHGLTTVCGLHNAGFREKCRNQRLNKRYSDLTFPCITILHNEAGLVDTWAQFLAEDKLRIQYKNHAQTKQK